MGPRAPNWDACQFPMSTLPLHRLRLVCAQLPGRIGRADDRLLSPPASIPSTSRAMISSITLRMIRYFTLGFAVAVCSTSLLARQRSAVLNYSFQPATDNGKPAFRIDLTFKGDADDLDRLDTFRLGQRGQPREGNQESQQECPARESLGFVSSRKGLGNTAGARRPPCDC